MLSHHFFFLSLFLLKGLLRPTTHYTPLVAGCNVIFLNGFFFIFFQVGLGPGLDLKLHPGVRSSRNSMKVLTARTDVSYLRDYKTGGEEGYAGRFCAFRVFLFFSNPASPISPVHSLCLSVGVCGTSPSPQGLNAPALFYASSPWQGI